MVKNYESFKRNDLQRKIVIKGVMFANVEEEDAIEYTDDELEMNDEDMKRVYFKIRLDNKGLVLNKAFFMKKTARSTCMIMNEYINLKPVQE